GGGSGRRRWRAGSGGGRRGRGGWRGAGRSGARGVVARGGFAGCFRGGRTSSKSSWEGGRGDFHQLGVGAGQGVAEHAVAGAVEDGVVADAVGVAARGFVVAVEFGERDAGDLAAVAAVDEDDRAAGGRAFVGDDEVGVERAGGGVSAAGVVGELAVAGAVVADLGEALLAGAVGIGAVADEVFVVGLPGPVDAATVEGDVDGELDFLEVAVGGEDGGDLGFAAVFDDAVIAKEKQAAGAGA